MNGHKPSSDFANGEVFHVTSLEAAIINGEIADANEQVISSLRMFTLSEQTAVIPVRAADVLGITPLPNDNKIRFPGFLPEKNKKMRIIPADANTAILVKRGNSIDILCVAENLYEVFAGKTPVSEASRLLLAASDKITTPDGFTELAQFHCRDNPQNAHEDDTNRNDFNTALKDTSEPDFRWHFDWRRASRAATCGAAALAVAATTFIAGRAYLDSIDPPERYTPEFAAPVRTAAATSQYDRLGLRILADNAALNNQ